MNDSAIVAKHWELFPNYVFTDVETSLGVDTSFRLDAKDPD